jgi:hypothetical protein
MLGSQNNFRRSSSEAEQRSRPSERISFVFESSLTDTMPAQEGSLPLAPTKATSMKTLSSNEASSNELCKREADENAPKREPDTSSSPKRILFPVTPARSLGDEALAEFCSLANEFLSEMDADTIEPTSAEDSSAQSTINLKDPVQSRLIIAALRGMRAHFQLSTHLETAEGSHAKEEDLAPRLEPALRELLVNDRYYKLLPAPARAHVRAAALEAYNAGLGILFRNPYARLRVLVPMFQRMRAGEMSESERDLCCRCVSIMCVCVCVYAFMCHTVSHGYIVS